MGTDVVVYGGGCGGVNKQCLWEYGDVIIVIGTLIEVGSSGEGISFVGSSWLVDKLEVVICQFGKVAGYASVDALWVVIILEIFVVSEDDNGVWGTC